MTEPDADRYIGESKEIRKSLSWRSEAGRRRARVTLFTGSKSEGFLRCICGWEARHWTFRLELGSVEILRWDFVPSGGVVAQKHRNPYERPDGYPGKVRGDHEHHWRDPPGSTALAMPLNQTALLDSHADAFNAFCERANIEVGGHYNAPPFVQEVFDIESPR